MLTRCFKPIGGWDHLLIETRLRFEGDTLAVGIRHHYQIHAWSCPTPAKPSRHDGHRKRPAEPEKF